MNRHCSAAKVAVAPTAADRPPTRPSGIQGIDNLSWGAHLCQFYEDDDHLLEVLLPYFAAGLAAGEFCMWVTSGRIGVLRAKEALQAIAPDLDRRIERGQIEIIDYRAWYKVAGRFDASRVCRAWSTRYAQALARGFAGMRVSGDTSWVSEDEWDDFVRYEAQVDPLIHSSRIIALCTYPLADHAATRTYDVLGAHELTLLRRGGRWRALESYGRSRAQQALRQSEARLCATIESATDGIVTVDEDGVVISANPAAAAMFGYAFGELVGETIDVLVDHGRRERRPRDLLAIVDRGYFRRRRELRGRRRDGAIVPIDCAVSEIGFAHPRRLFAVCLQDLTERRRAEARIRRLNSDRLLAMGSVARTLAHEINQPLTATAAYLKAAKRMVAKGSESRAREAEEALDRACEQVLRAGDIIRRLRECIAHREPDKTCVRLHRLIAEVCDRMARGANVELVVGLGARDDLVIADAEQIERVMTNLIGNAIEALHAAERRRLCVSTTVVSARMIRVDVADSGPGLSETASARLFEPFESTKPRGLGVGLSLARSIVEAHYGQIWAEPNEGGGTVFSFTLPLAE